MLRRHRIRIQSPNSQSFRITLIAGNARKVSPSRHARDRQALAARPLESLSWNDSRRFRSIASCCSSTLVNPLRSSQARSLALPISARVLFAEILAAELRELQLFDRKARARTCINDPREIVNRRLLRGNNDTRKVFVPRDYPERRGFARQQVSGPSRSRLRRAGTCFSGTLLSESRLIPGETGVVSSKRVSDGKLNNRGVGLDF